MTTAQPREIDFEGAIPHDVEDDYDTNAEYRSDELRALPLPLQRPVCQRCFLELPVSMVCGNC